MDGSAGGATANAVMVTKLASDQSGVATNVAPMMVNAWGIVGFDGKFWITDAGTGKIAIVDANGAPATGKLASGALDLGMGITGIAATQVAADDMTMFQVHGGATCGAAQLIVASTAGKLIGINTTLSTTGGFTVVDRADAEASYTGVAVLAGTKADHGKAGSAPLILAADFHNARLDVFDASFARVDKPAFVVPSAPAGYAPFNVMTFDGKVFVTYAQQDENKEEEVTGPGLGFVAVFDAAGTLLGTAKGMQLNAPWGMAMVHGFAGFDNALLVGNFGDGAVTAIDPVKLNVLGQLSDTTGGHVLAEGMWGLVIGDGVTGARADGVYFAAGPEDETHGLFGVIAPAPTPET